MTGAELLVEFLAQQHVQYAAGIPGHGCWSVVDALAQHASIATIQVMHEQSAVHLADGFYRVSGRPMLAFASIGPGQVIMAVGLATAMADSTAVLAVTGSPHTYMRGHGVLQELERRHQAENPRMFEPMVKEWWQPSRLDELPFVLHRAWNQLTSGRPGPVLIDFPMDLQAESWDLRVPSQERRSAGHRVRPAQADVERAARILTGAKRPVIVAGGGAILSNASGGLTTLAEILRAPVVTTWQGKGAIDETHELAGLTIGDTGSTCGNELASSADVILSVGNRFTDWSASSYRQGATFSIPPTRLIQVDIDPREIGKNYPVELGLVGDAAITLEDLIAALGPSRPARRTDAYFREIQRRKARWFAAVEFKSGANRRPIAMARAIREIQSGVRDDAIVVTGAGLPQGVVKQRWIVRHPRTHITSGGFSTMGFELPAAIGCQLAAPDRQVIAIAGDGSFLQTMQELATLAMLDLPVCVVVLDNSGWISIKAGQEAVFSRTAATDFMRHGEIYSPDYEAIGNAFGVQAALVRKPAEVRGAIERAFASGGPSLVVLPVDRDLRWAGPDKTGWWDAPVPDGRPAADAYRAGVLEEQHR